MIGFLDDLEIEQSAGNQNKWIKLEDLEDGVGHKSSLKVLKLDGQYKNLNLSHYENLEILRIRNSSFSDLKRFETFLNNDCNKDCNYTVRKFTFFIYLLDYFCYH